MFERRNERLLPLAEFRTRVFNFFMLALGVTLIWLAIGVVGFMLTDNLAFDDALLNASMLVGQMGPTANFTTSIAKYFASFYAIASGLVFIGITSIAFAPIIHRLFHHFHLSDTKKD